MLLAGVGPVVGAPAAQAQRPAVAPAVARAAGRDTTVTVWLFARPGLALSDLRAFVQSSGGRVRRTSRWLRAVSAELRGDAIAPAAVRTDLLRIQPVRRFARRPVPGPVAVALPIVAPQDSVYGPSAMPLRRLNLFPLVERGQRGKGVRIAVFDSGFETELAIFATTRVAAQYDFVFNDSVVRNEAGDNVTASTHGTSVWSLFAANAPDTLIGIAPAAIYLLAKTEDVRSETPLEEDNYVAALEWADSIGVDIVSSSIGYTTFDDGTGYLPQDLDGDIAVTTIAADLAAERGILVVTAAGNGGPGPTTLITPADGDSVLAVGAEDSTGTLAGFSARGPTADGRIKPDFTAPGVAVLVAAPDGFGGVRFQRADGTSFSTPILAAAAALFREAHPTFGPVDILTALRAAAANRLTPDNNRGWGRPDVALATTFPQGLLLGPLGRDTLRTVTPTFRWSFPDVPASAQPVSYRLQVGRDATFSVLLLDTTLADTSVTLEAPLSPLTRFVYQVTATSVDSIERTITNDTAFVVPPWVELVSFDDPGGVIVRDLRPRFVWTAPSVESPPGPFEFDLAIIRAADGGVDFTFTGIEATSFTPPRELERNTPYRWRVTARLGTDSVSVESRGTFVIVDDSAPPVTTLFQNFPNPFPDPGTGRTSTCIWFDLAVEGVVRLQILDLRGHLVRSLLPAPGQSLFFRPGRYGRPDPVDNGSCDPRTEWDGTDANDAPVAPGVYLARLVTPAGTFFKRIVFVGGR